jgi:hypothetical protein
MRRIQKFVGIHSSHDFYGENDQLLRNAKNAANPEKMLEIS